MSGRFITAAGAYCSRRKDKSILETLSIEKVGRRLGLRREAAHEAAMRGEIQTVWVDGIFLPHARVPRCFVVSVPGAAALLGKGKKARESAAALTALCKWTIEGDNCFCDSPAPRHEAYCEFHSGIAALYKKSAQTE